MNTLVDRLSGYVAALAYEKLPPEVVHQTKRMKRFPLGQYSQTVAEAAIEARQRVASPDDTTDVHVETLGTAIRLMAGDPQK